MKKRILKKPDVRKAEIIAVADKLFQKHGYESTPVEAIIKEAGIAKGTFYYYFKTKKDILHALVDSICLDLEEHFKTISEKLNLDAKKKFKLMIRGSEKQTKIKPRIMKVIHLPENRELQEQLNIKAVKMIAPHLFTVIEQGYKDGLFKRPVSVESIQIILAGSQFILDSGLFEWSAKKRGAFLKAIQQLFELISGAKPDSLRFISKE